MKLKAAAIILSIMAASVNVQADDIFTATENIYSEPSGERYSFEPQTSAERYSFEPAAETSTERYSFEPAAETSTERYSFEPASQTSTEFYSEQMSEISTSEILAEQNSEAVSVIEEITVSEINQDTSEESTEQTSEESTEQTSEESTEQISEEPSETTTQAVPEVFFNEEIGGYGIRNYDGEINYINPAEAIKPLTYRVTRNNQYLKTQITIMIGEIPFVLTPEQKARCLEGINTDEPYINKDVVWQISNNICTLYNHKNNQLFMTSSGETIKITEGDYGWSVDFTGLTDSLYDALSTKTDTILKYEPRNANYNVPKPSMTADIGPNYAEVDLTLQKIFIYKNNELVLEDDCVTGKSSTPTPVGIYSLKCNRGRTMLKGPTWETWVNYWMHFYDGCGFHDASWQSSFGIERWKAGYGSHGCVNLKPETAKKLSNILYVGEPVIVHK